MALDPNHVKQMLHKLRDRRDNIFGAETHRFSLNDPLPVSAVSAFETQNNVQLPEAYRDFLCNIGNGGAGPSYGLFPLGQMDSGFDLKIWHQKDGLIGVLSQPFPHTKPWNDLAGLPTESLRLIDQREYDRKMEEFECRYWNSSLVDGAIPICHEGCAIRIWLVITGNQSGYLWSDNRSEYKGLLPLLTNDGMGLTFTVWYEAWLASALQIAGLNYPTNASRSTD